MWSVAVIDGGDTLAVRLHAADGTETRRRLPMGPWETSCFKSRTRWTSVWTKHIDHPDDGVEDDDDPVLDAAAALRSGGHAVEADEAFGRWRVDGATGFRSARCWSWP